MKRLMSKNEKKKARVQIFSQNEMFVDLIWPKMYYFSSSCPELTSILLVPQNPLFLFSSLFNLPDIKSTKCQE